MLTGGIPAVFPWQVIPLRKRTPLNKFSRTKCALYTQKNQRFPSEKLSWSTLRAHNPKIQWVKGFQLVLAAGKQTREQSAPHQLCLKGLIVKRTQGPAIQDAAWLVVFFSLERNQQNPSLRRRGLTCKDVTEGAIPFLFPSYPSLPSGHRQYG